MLDEPLKDSLLSPLVTLKPMRPPKPFVKDAVRQLTLWLLLVLLVCVCTVLFTLLGVLFTAVLTGILMGGSRRWKWQAIPVSLVFPLVAFALGNYAHTSLEPRQRVLMVILCFGAFWVIYLTSLWLMRMEARPVADEEGVHSAPLADGVDGASRTEAACARDVGLTEPVAAASAVPEAQLELRDFEGTWFCETSGPNGEFRTCLMTVAKGKFALEIRNPRGLACRVAEGVLRLEDAARGQSLLISAASSEESVSSW